MAVATLSHDVSYSSAAASSHRSHYPPHAKPEAPPSPPMDSAETRCSLPSISNLIAVSDAGSPTPTADTYPRNSSCYDLPQSSQLNGAQIRSAMPPTPPMSTDASLDSSATHSPSSRSVSQFSTASTPSASNYYYEPTPPLDESHLVPRHNSPGSITATPRTSLPAPAPAPFPQSAYIDPYYAAAIPPPPQPQPGAMGLYYQRQLPQSFAPFITGANPWQHHHFVPPTAASHYPQSQDRYVCQTCNKAFSRPSSLRIHSHSHTGEKPFKCPHPSCGKAFSVRSNMKRHERGCHTAPYETHPHAHLRRL